MNDMHKRPSFFRVPKREQISLAKRLSMMLKSGMPITEGLHMIREEATGASPRHLTDVLIATVSEGRPLSHGLSQFESHFGSFAINIVRVGEVSGTLHQNLEYLADEMKRSQTLRGKVIGALIYPALIIAVTMGITLMLTVYIFPKIIPVFQSVKANLPWSTKFLITLSQFLGGNWIEILLALFMGGCFFYVAFKRLPKFRLFIDTLLLRIPVIGKLLQCYALATICRTLSLLLKSDIRILEAMQLVAAATNNRAYRLALTEGLERIVKGQRISAQFSGNKLLFPPMLGQLMTVGETTGSLAPTLAYLSEMFEEEVNELTKNLTTLIEPVLMIIMGLVVGFIAISIITPIYSITQNLNPR